MLAVPPWPRQEALEAIFVKKNVELINQATLFGTGGWKHPQRLGRRTSVPAQEVTEGAVSVVSPKKQ